MCVQFEGSHLFFHRKMLTYNFIANLFNMFQRNYFLTYLFYDQVCLHFMTWVRRNCMEKDQLSQFFHEFLYTIRFHVFCERKQHHLLSFPVQIHCLVGTAPHICI